MDMLILLQGAAKSGMLLCQQRQYLLVQVSVQLVQTPFFKYVLSALVDKLET